MPNVRKSRVFRVTGLPANKNELEIQSIVADVINKHLTGDERRQPTPKIGCVPSCDGNKSLIALVEFQGETPQFFSQLAKDPLSDWQVEIGNEDINFDCHFFGFTQLYPTAAGHSVTADIIAITGLDGHAYGSWRGKGNRRWMWLRDFLSKDLPNCRTMIYGYNSKLSSHGINNIMGYGREFLEGIKRIRYTKELQERPIFFIAHSYGGIILAHCLIKAVQADEHDHPTIASLYKATYGILFFGTPHKGLVIGDMKRMVAGEARKLREDGEEPSGKRRKLRQEHGNQRSKERSLGLDKQDIAISDPTFPVIQEGCEKDYEYDKNWHPRMQLLDEIKPESSLLMYQLPDFKNLIRDRKIVSFCEMLQSRRLEPNSETGSWGRTGEFTTAVDSGSTLLNLPDNIEAKIPVNADHSQIVKFDSKNAEAYKTALEYLKQFERDAGRVVSTRFLPTLRKKQAISTVPFDRDKNFVGRKGVLEDLESRFSLNDTHNRAVLAGLGGVGKSQIAIEFSYRLRTKDPQLWVFWIHAGTAERFEQGYKSIASTLELPDRNDPKTDTLALVLKWLSNIENGRWLLILDNADDINVFKQTQIESSQNGESALRTLPLSSYIPQTATGSILFTTRDRSVASWLSTGFTSVIPVDIMESSDAEKLLSIKIPEGLSTSYDRFELIKELDYLPLAITQAAAYIGAKSMRMTVAKYLNLYRHDEISQSRLLDEDSGDLRRDPNGTNSVFRTWQISFDQMKRTRPQAAQLLSFMAMLDRQSIPEVLLSARFPNTLDFEEALASLEEFSLISIETGGKSFEMHRLVQLATRKWLEQHNENEEWQRIAIEILSGIFPWSNYDNQIICKTLLPHAREALKYDLVSNEYLRMSAVLLYRMASYSQIQGHYSNAIGECRESLKILKQISKDDDEIILKVEGLLAIVLDYQGRYDEAEPLFRQILAVMERVFGKEHAETVGNMMNLASLLLKQGKYGEAEHMHREGLELQKKTLGPEHPDTLMSMNNLANSLQDRGNYDEAEHMHREILELRRKISSPEHPDALNSMNNLASTLRFQGNYDEAEQMHREVLELRRKVLGPEHPDTLMSMNNLASVMVDQGMQVEAERVLREVLELLKRVLSLEHPHTLRSMRNLAYVMGKQGMYVEAERMHRDVLELQKKILGPEHPYMLKSMSNLAMTVSNQGIHIEADRMYREVLELRKKTLGLEHPDTLKSMSNLAWTMSKQGIYVEAERIHREVLELQRKVLGSKHPDTLLSVKNLVRVLNTQGKYAEAEQVRKQCPEPGKEALLGHV